MKKGWFLFLIIFSSCVEYNPQYQHSINGIDFKENYHIELKQSVVTRIDLVVENEVEIYSKYRLSFDEKLIEKIYQITNTYEIEIRTKLIRSPREFATYGISTMSDNGVLNPEFVMKIELFQNNKKIKLELLEGLVIKYNTRDQYYSWFKLYNNRSQTDQIKSWNCPIDIDICKVEFEQRIGTLIGYDAQGKKTKTENHTYYSYIKEVTLKPVFKDWILVGREVIIDETNLEKVSFRIFGLNEDTRVGVVLRDYNNNGYLELEPVDNVYSTFYTKIPKRSTMEFVTIPDIKIIESGNFT